MRGFPRLLWEYIVASYFRWWMGIVTAGITLITTYEWLTAKTVPIPIWARLSFAFAALLTAPFLAYKELAEKLQKDEMEVKPKRAELYILPDADSRYLVHADPRDRRKLLGGMFIKLHLAIENKGERNSIISGFDLHIQETNRYYEKIKPQYKTAVHSRRALCTIGPTPFLSKLATVRATDMLGPAVLLFYVPERPPVDCSRVNCRLTIHDTEGNTASHVFELSEA